MLPKLRGDTRYIPTARGVLLRNNRRELTIPGRHIYEWVDRIAPHLDGSHTVAELVDGLPVERARMVEQIIEVLTAAGFVKDVTADRPHTLTDAEVKAYAAEIAFVDYFRDSAPARFQAFRQARIGLLGSGQVLAAAAAAVLAMGVRGVEVVVTGECVTDRDRCREGLRRARERGPDQSMTLRDAADGELDEPTAVTALDGFDALVHVSDRPMLARARTLERACRRTGTLLVQAVVTGDEAWIGPLVDPEDGPAGGWESGWRRLQATHGHPDRFAFTDHPQEPVSEYLASPTAALVGNQACFEVFKQLTGIPPSVSAHRMMRVDLATLRTGVHRFLDHPACLPDDRVPPATAATTAATIARLRDGQPLDEDGFSVRAAACVDAELGIFTSVEEGELRQLPLNLTQVTIAGPAGSPGQQLHAYGAGADVGAARHAATRRACELYAAATVDHRRLVGGTADRQVWGYDLLTHRPRRVAAAAVFPSLRGELPTAANAPYLGSGTSWAEAVCTALSAVCRAVTVAELAHREDGCPLLDLDAAPLDERGRRHVGNLRAAGVPVAVHEITGALGVPSFAFCLAGRTIAHRSGPDVPEALGHGLEQLVLAHQAQRSSQPQYAPAGVADLPERLRGTRPTRCEPVPPGDRPAQQQRLCRALACAGHRPVAVPLDHDPAVAEVLPYLVHVVVT